jgi:hypothetical protein
MICEKQFSTTNPSKYAGYDDMYHKKMTDGIADVINSKREYLFCALKSCLCADLSDIDLEDKITLCCEEVDLSDSVLIFCFRYRAAFSGKCNPFPEESKFNNDCCNETIEKAHAKEILVCVRIEKDDSKQ